MRILFFILIGFSCHAQHDIIAATNYINQSAFSVLPYQDSVVQDLRISEAIGDSVPDYANTGDVRDIQTGMNTIAFDGSQYAIRNYDAVFDGDPVTKSFFICFWFKIQKDPANDRRIYWRDQTSKREFQIFMNTSGLMQVNLFKAGVATTISSTTAVDLGDNIWHHFAFYYDPTKAVIYIDGLFATATNTWTGPRDVFDSQVAIGGQYTSSSRRLIGSLADFRFYHSFDLNQMDNLVRGRIFGTEKVWFKIASGGTQMIDCVGGKNLPITGTLAYSQQYVDNKLTYSIENDRGYTVSDGTSYYYESALTNLIPAGIRIPANETDPTKCAAYVSGGVLGGLQYTGSAPLPGQLIAGGDSIILNPFNAPKLRREGFDDTFVQSIASTFIPPPAYKSPNNARIVVYRRPENISFNIALQICGALGGRPGTVHLEDYAMITHDGVTDDQLYINRVMRATGAQKVVFDAYDYAISRSLTAYCDIDTEPGSEVIVRDDFTDYFTTFQLAEKIRQAVFKVGLPSIIFNMQGNIFGNQQYFEDTYPGLNWYIHGIVNFRQDNITVSECNCTEILDCVFFFDSSGHNISNVSVSLPADNPDKRNAAVDIIGCSNTVVSNIFADGTSEAFDINGNNTFITFTNIEGNNLDEGVVEINNSNNITGSTVTGNTSTGSLFRVTAANNYTGANFGPAIGGYYINVVCGDLNITDVQGTPSSLVQSGTGTGGGGAGAY